MKDKTQTGKKKERENPIGNKDHPEREIQQNQIHKKAFQRKIKYCIHETRTDPKTNKIINIPRRTTKMTSIENNVM